MDRLAIAHVCVPNKRAVLHAHAHVQQSEALPLGPFLSAKCRARIEKEIVTTVRAVKVRGRQTVKSASRKNK